MNKKIFFITIPMLPSENLKMIRYRKEDAGELFSEPSRFPGIPMLEWSILGKEEIKIVTVRTDDDAKRTQANYELFKEELASLGKNIDTELKIDAEILLPHSENKDKQMSLLKEICSHFEPDADIYMDITFGTKVTPIGMFSSLVYAEKIMRCNIKSVVYGKYAHNDSSVGELYDVRPLYEMAMLINTADDLPQHSINAILGELWGK